MTEQEFLELKANDFENPTIHDDIQLSLSCLQLIVEDYMRSENKFCPECLNDCTLGEIMHDGDCLFGKVIKRIKEKINE